MTAGQLERNLVTFLDPHGECDEDGWRFAEWRDLSVRRDLLDAEGERERRTVISFDRGSYVDYLLFPWIARLSPGLAVTRRVLCVRDGLLSCFFDAGNADGYCAYANNHVPRPSTLRQKLVSLLPLSFRAEKRFIVTVTKGREGESSRHRINRILEEQDLLFYSNPAGKLVLAAAATCRSGKGIIVKTTANPEYRKVMEKEFAIMKSLTAPEGRGGSLPAAGECIRSGNRVYFTEEYVMGHTLLEVLRNLSFGADADAVCAMLDRLDDWFEGYLSRFTDAPVPVSSSYRHLFASFAELYGGKSEGVEILEKAGKVVRGEKSPPSPPITTFGREILWFETTPSSPLIGRGLAKTGRPFMIITG